MDGALHCKSWCSHQLRGISILQYKIFILCSSQRSGTRSRDASLRCWHHLLHCRTCPLVTLVEVVRRLDFSVDIFDLLTCFKCERLVPSNYNNELKTEDIGFNFWLCGMLDMSHILYCLVPPALSDDFNDSSPASQKCCWWALINIFKVFWASYLCTVISIWNMIRFEKQWLFKRLIITRLIVYRILHLLLAACMSANMVLYPYLPRGRGFDWRFFWLYFYVSCLNQFW